MELTELIGVGQWKSFKALSPDELQKMIDKIADGANVESGQQQPMED